MDDKRGITAIVLAGGRGRRLGGWDKGLLDVAGRPLIDRVIGALRPQVDQVIISANRHLDLYRRFRCPVVEDAVPGFQGPLAGLAAGMAVAATDYVLAVPGDAPMLPPDLASRLCRHLGDAEIAVVDDDEDGVPPAWLVPTALREDLRRFLARGGRDPLTWLSRHNTRPVDFSDWPRECWRVEEWADLPQVERYLQVMEPRRARGGARGAAETGT